MILNFCYWDMIFWSSFEKIKDDSPGYFEITDKEDPQLDLISCMNKDEHG